LPAGLADANTLLRRAYSEAIAPDPDLLVSEWADRHRRLSTKASALAGPWVTARTPYLREIMDAMSLSHPCGGGDFMKGTQIGGSEALYNAIGYTVSEVPCSMMLVMPTVDTAKLVSQQRLQPMIDETPVLARKLGEQKSRDTANTTLKKDYAGGMLLLRGANSGPGLRSAPIRVLLMDEIDAYPDDVDGEGEPCAVAEKRTESFGARAKVFTCSSPKIKGKSRAERRYLRGSRARYYVPCPHCAAEQWLKWSQVRWQMEVRREHRCSGCGGVSEITTDQAAPTHCEHCALAVNDADIHRIDTEDVAEAWYDCEACGERIDEHHKPAMLERGRHIHEQPGPCELLDDNDTHPHALWAWISGKVRRVLPRFRRPLSWHVSALYSPLGWFSWRKAVTQFLEAQGGGFNAETGETLQQVFDNTVLGITYEIKGEQPQQSVLKLRAESYNLGQVPAGALLLVAAVDVQGNRFEVKVKGYGRGLESWLIDYHVIPFSFGVKEPAEDDWAKVLQIRNKAYLHAGGQSMRITAMFVDSGYLTQNVYDFTRRWTHRAVCAIKGDAGLGKRLLSTPSLQDVSHHGKLIKGGVQLWKIGVDTAKEQIYSRLDITEPGPGYMHFPRGLPDAYYDGLASEKLVRKRVKGVDMIEWLKVVERNEPLDLEVYCYAAAVYAGATRLNWDHLEAVINPAQRDLISEAARADANTKGADADPPAHAAGATDAAPPTSAPPPQVHDIPQKPAASGFFNAQRPRRPNWVTGFR
jgi:phage terminase large subunit GpA-like protein